MTPESLNRRDFLTLTALTAGTIITRATFGQSSSETTTPTTQPAHAGVSATLSIVSTQPTHAIPENFTGLSYELAQLTDPHFFASSNKQLITLFKLLSPKGVLRLGGNSSETCWLKVDESTQPPEAPKVNTPADQHWMPTQVFQIDTPAVDNLGDFLKATGWQLIYGLNFGHSSPERLAKEAEYIASKVGGSMLYFQIGNEPDFYSAANNRTRPANWGFKDYMREWLACAKAILAKVPDAKFGGPDAGSTSKNWLGQFIPIASKELGEHLVAASNHHYAEGPPDDPKVTTARLLRTDPKIAQQTLAASTAAGKHGLVYRMTEGNTCYRGGKPGMSDAFASALWGGDYMLTLAANGCGGVNLHGGSRNMIKASLGNHLPGEKVAPAGADTKGGFYTPIAGELAEGFKVRPLFYGMMLANQFAGANFVPSKLSQIGIDANAFVCRKERGYRIAVFNKDTTTDLSVSINLPEEIKASECWRLTGSALDATTGVTLAGAEVTADGTWTASPVAAHQPSAGKSVDVLVPHDSAVLLFVDV